MRFLLLGLLTVTLCVANIFMGSVDIPATEVWQIITGSQEVSSPLRFIVLESRLPQSLTALLAGAGLAVTGLLLQTAFRNPLAGPSILGISSGASLGVALVTLLFGGTLTLGDFSWGGNAALVAGALAGSFMIMGVLMLLSLRLRNDLMLLIAGILTGYLTSSIVTLLSSLSSAEGVQSFVMWGMGTFGGVALDTLPWFGLLTLCSLLLALMMAKPLNILLLGDNYARNLGIRIGRVRNLLLIITGLLTAVITAYCGPVSFIGLAMPHISRMLFRTDNHWILIPATMLVGAIVALACNLASVVGGSVIPVNALTPIIGVPVILYVLLRRR